MTKVRAVLALVGLPLLAVVARGERRSVLAHELGQPGHALGSLLGARHGEDAWKAADR